ncbi:MAG TPA: AMP-binding protein, partial [Steroidobacteraceae bacterium]|nr:AMP-binding protein [Steroidobacteraceae bacterium]
ARWAARLGDKTYLAQRAAPGGPWIEHSYAATRRDADAFAQWLLDRGIERGRALLILSGNSIQHAVAKYGAMSARVPVCPVSVNYSLLGGDFGRLRHVVGLVRPAVVLAEQAVKYRNALENVDFGDAVIVTDDPAALARPAVSLGEVLSTRAGAAVARSIAAIHPDEPAAYMLTSGSTSLPKAVIQTQRMITANLAQGRQVLGETAGWREVMLDWLPWNHVSGAFTKMGVLTSGGTLYIDGGRPLPGQFEESLANLKEIAPHFYVNVPAGYAMLADALERDEALRQRFFSRVRLALYGGAGLPQALYDRIQSLAVRTVGERIFFTSGYGATETSSGCMAIYFPTEEVGIGLPMPGLTVKLVPLAGRYEVRMQGPMITPGYLTRPDLNAEIFDEEGFYRTGDAAQFHDPQDVGKGLKFAGRLAEDFKLATGTWVSAGRLRAELLEACAPAFADLLVCGEHREHVAVLAWPSAAGCRVILGADAPSDPGQLRTDARLRAWLAGRLAAFDAERASSARVERLALLAEPPSVDRHEVSDKGTINQRVALDRRQRDVEMLYANPPAPEVILPAGRASRSPHA